MPRASVPSRRPDRGVRPAGERLRRVDSTPSPSAPDGGQRRAVDGAPSSTRHRVAPGDRAARDGHADRWFCCLGGGDEESQQKTFERARQGLRGDAPGHHGQDRPHGLRGCPRRVRRQGRLGQPARRRRAARRRRRVGVRGSVARPAAARRQVPGRPHRLRPSRWSTCTRPAARACSGSRSRSIRRSCTTSSTCSTRPASSTRRRSTASSTRCRTARWSTGTTTPSARSRCC